ncbi:GTP cyclohydrolase I FolE [Paramaledivibacter caminithermalis]|jgi:GTP cyclohydrolase I|uniref:GTP cyclohydrolase 1 n=1 Tax=Paramaledivibacter caminithermalis (strain DSM 15212 / CIP 107654 / DViRD3) TaxID=1121301 RepID=A0A1M6R0C6_PARC5|nr:GTP cyclohydrolase I FolE [Paramaledivibacter caminithermalis]SHK25850.1 GTP cyclohydrolase I [Paramaledivibacter caminithermalis DSM 15212]
MAINKEKIMEYIRGILIEIGEDIEREGLIDTPKRVADMYEEIFEGIRLTNDDIANMFKVTFDNDLDIVDKYDDMVLLKNIKIFSYCEHHLALMYNMSINIAYIPKDRVIGLSKMARIAEMVGKRLQLQERIGSDIAEILERIINTNDIAVIIKAEHACIAARGIKKTNSETITTTLRGKFNEDRGLLNNLMMLVK